MAYSERARALRRCSSLRADGAPCGSYAVWGDPGRRCWLHGGKRPEPIRRTWREEAGYSPRRRHAPACRCAAYQWPHRPGAGFCRWPEPPLKQCCTRPGVRSGPGRSGRLRGVGVRGFAGILGLSKREIRSREA